MPQPRLHASHAERQAAYRRRQRQAQSQQVQEYGLLLHLATALSATPGKVRWRQLAVIATTAMELAGDEMDTYYDARSESWQESDKADAFKENQDAVQEALNALGRADW